MASKARWWETNRNLGFAGTVTATVVASLCIALLPSLSNVRSAIGLAWAMLILPVDVPLVVVIGGAVVVLIGMTSAVRRSLKPTPPAWRTYTADTFLGVVWRWYWAGNIASSINAYCPRCNTGLRGEQHGYVNMESILICDECQFIVSIPGNREKVIERIERLIEREANKRAIGEP